MYFRLIKFWEIFLDCRSNIKYSSYNYCILPSTFINRALWTDAVNSWNCRIWSTNNSHECHEQPL